MRLFEAILDANQRALAGDAKAGVRPGEFPDELPVVALTCIDARLNPLMPEVLGLPEEQFIWLRNAGNIITGQLSSTMRSLALACAVKGGREIAIIGHTDCLVGKTTTMQLLERFRSLGVERHLLPDNITEFFGMFSSERQNVINAVDLIRSSPIIGPRIPVHGLLVDIQTGKLEWLVNGYEAPRTMGAAWNQVVQSAGQTVDALKSMTNFQIGDLKFPDTKIGEAVTHAVDWVSEKIEHLEVKPPEPPQPGTPPSPPVPPKIQLPPPLRPRLIVRRDRK